MKRCDGFFIILPIGGDFLSPEFSAGLGPFEQVAVVSMPEASVHEYNSTPAGQNDVGFPGQVPDMKAIAEAERMQPAPDGKFRLRVLSPDTGHHPASGGGWDDVSQLPSATAAPSCGPQEESFQRALQGP